MRTFFENVTANKALIKVWKLYGAMRSDKYDDQKIFFNAEVFNLTIQLNSSLFVRF